jgi:hypothetical protein
MIVQIAQLRNELPLIKELLPIWTKYADGFVFLLDTNTDDTLEYLAEVKEQFNILDVLTYTESTDAVKMETDNRQLLFDTAKQYSNNIICLDADEYFDGTMSKQELENLLENNPNTVFHLRWVQYTSTNTIRVDGPWENNYKDRVGNYNKPCSFIKTQMHSTHLPIPENQQALDPSTLFIAHLQWLDNNHVAIKQYFWKVMDFVNNKEFGVHVAGNEAYDASVNNFNWEEEYFNYPLQVRSDIFSDIPNKYNYRVNWIKDQIALHNIPSLGDWGLNIHESVPMYFYVSCNNKHYNLLLNLLGSLHRYNFNDIVEICVVDTGLSENQRKELANIKKVVVHKLEENHTPKYPYALKLSLNSTVISPLNKLFINQIEPTKQLVDYEELVELTNGIFEPTFELIYDSYKLNTSSLKRRFNVSCITAIGDLDKYERFIDSYFNNIQSQIDFSRTEFVIVYKEWSNKFDKYQSYKNIVFIQEIEKNGVYGAWNIGLQNCVSEYVTNWNIDDIRYPLNLKIKLDALNRDINIDLVYNYYVAMTPNEIELGVDPSSKSYLTYPDNFHDHVKSSCMAGPDPLWRKSYHAFGGYFDAERFSIIGDWEMWIRMAAYGLKMRLVPHVLCIYGDHGDTVSNSSSVKLEEQKELLTNLYNNVNIPIADSMHLGLTV